MTERQQDFPTAWRRRVAIDRVIPEVDGGRFAAKRIRGDIVTIEADIICDGHEELDCRLLVRHGGAGQWLAIPMECQGNDRWTAAFVADRIGGWQYAVAARIDAFATWLRDLDRRDQAGENLDVELVAGARLVAAAAHLAPPAVAREIESFALTLRSADWRQAVASPRLRELMSLYADRRDETRLDPPRPLWVDREKARCSAWYEVFPRSWGPAGKHGTLVDLADRLDYVAGLGFDVLYLTPIHPIGHSFRKGRNNALVATPDDVGSPWGIGSAEGGHTAIHPALGTLADFAHLRRRAEALGMELALDIAVQCSPDHPWVREHPEWFRHRADGTIAYAENPPKKYQDIVPFDFQCEQWPRLWEAVRDVFRFWVEQGVKIFRVDNPHTKPFAFWEWLITEVHRAHPDVLFLSEAFTRPKTMYRLAKLGFTQSYTYFTWRTEKREMADYLVEVTTPPVAEFFRPNFWPNTPDILHATLQQGGPAMFEVRLTLAALSVGNWGIYGPALELLEAKPREPGSEEYLDSEKYEIKAWNLDAPESLAPFIRRLNEIRRTEPALQRARPPLVQEIDDDHLLAWCRHDPATGNTVLVVVNMEPAETRSGRLTLDTAALGLRAASAAQGLRAASAAQGLRAASAAQGFRAASAVAAHDLLTGADVVWPLDAITIECSPEHPVQVYRLSCAGPAGAEPEAP